jgi:secreted trypsin-like serine protease
MAGRAHFRGSMTALAVGLAAGAASPTLSDQASQMVPYVWCGRPVAVEDFPWQVAVTTRRGREDYSCGGAVIADMAILTAAHCVTQSGSTQPVTAGNITVRAGSTWRLDSIPQAVDRVIVHDGWLGAAEPDGRDLGIDAAVLILAKPLANARPIPIRIAPVTAPLGAGVVAGWGFYGDGPQLASRLLGGEVAIIPAAACRTLVPGTRAGSVSDHNVCTKSDMVVQCAGDSGGPLVIGSTAQPQLVGIASWKLGQGCEFTASTHVGVFAAGAALASFVQRHVPAARTTQEPPVPFSLWPRGRPESRYCSSKKGEWI